MTKLTGSEMSEQFSRFINSSSSIDKIEFSEEIASDHKTLQEDSFKTFLNCIEIWADYYDKGNYDARNEYTVKASKAMLQGMKDAGLY